MKIVFLAKRWYTNKDLVEDKYGRCYEIPKLLSNTEGLEVHLVCLDYHSLKRIKPVKINDGSLIIIPHTTGRGFRLLDIFLYLLSVRKYVRDINPDILIGTSDALHIIIARYLSGLTRAKLVIDLYDNYEAFSLTHLPFVYRLYKKAIRQADGITAVTSELADHIGKIKPKAMIKVIGNAVAAGFNTGRDRAGARETMKLPQQGILVGTAGDLSRKRGIDVLLQAFNLLRSESSDYYLILAGKLEQGVIPEHSSDRIIYLGELDYKYVAVLFRALDVGIINNLDNKFGNYCHPQKACEMIACQLPIVAANVGYMSRALKSVPGILYTPGDYKELAKAIEYQAQRKIIANLTVNTWQQQAELFNKFLDDVIAN